MAPAVPDGSDDHRVRCHLGALLDERGMTLQALSERVGVTVANLSVLKNDRARAVRFSTLTAICDVLRCQPGELFSVEPAGRDAGAPPTAVAGER